MESIEMAKDEEMVVARISGENWDISSVKHFRTNVVAIAVTFSTHILGPIAIKYRYVLCASSFCLTVYTSSTDIHDRTARFYTALVLHFSRLAPHFEVCLVLHPAHPSALLLIPKSIPWLDSYGTVRDMLVHTFPDPHRTLWNCQICSGSYLHNDYLVVISINAIMDSHNCHR